MATKQEIRDYFAKFGKQGGKARANNMTPEQRSAAARKAVEARWSKSISSIDKNLARTKDMIEEMESRQKRRKRKQAEK